MKKSQSIFLLSGFVPLVAAPIAIVASCSNDTTTVKSESQVEAERLNGLIQSSKIKILSGKETLNDAMLTEISNNPNKLLDDYLDKKELALNEEKFTYNIAELAGVEPKQDTTAKTISFKFRVVNKTNAGETYDSVVASVAYQYQATPQSPEQTLINTAITEIEKAHAAKTFKLKDDKQTITQNEIDALKTNPQNFLTQYTDGLPSSIDKSLTTTVKKNNFSVADKATGSKQQQAGKQQTITFKVTVSHSAAKLESDTQNLTFDFTLQDAASPNKVATAAKTGLTATALGLQNSKVSAAQTQLNEAWVADNITKLLDGDQEVTGQADVTALTVTLNAQDSTKLTLSFKLVAQKWYQADGTLGNAESSLFTFEITGFTKADVISLKKNEFPASELGDDFGTKNFDELNNLMNRAAWLLENKDRYLQGDLAPGTTPQNFVQGRITFTKQTADPTKAVMTFSIAAGRSYNAQGQATTTATSISFTVTDITQ